MAKILFFTKTSVPTAAEKTAITRLEAKGYDVKVRNASVDTKYGPTLEACDGVAGAIPTAYNAKTDVTLPPVAKPEDLQVLPDTATKAHPSTQQLQVLKADQDESTGAITIADVTGDCTYASSDEGAATVDANGLITTVAAGETTVTATYPAVAAAKAALDCGQVPTKQLDTILEATTAGTAGNAITVALAMDDATGVTINRSTNAFVIHAKPGTSTVGDVETAIAALAGADDLFGVKTAGTAARVLTADAAFPAQALTGGAAAVTSTATCVFTVS